MAAVASHWPPPHPQPRSLLLFLVPFSFLLLLAAPLLFFLSLSRKRRTPADGRGAGDPLSAVVKISLAAPAGVDASPLVAAVLASSGSFDSGPGLRPLPPSLRVEEEQQPPVTAGGGGGEKGEGLNAGEEVKAVGRKKKKRKRVRKRKKKKSEDEPPAQHGEEKGEAVGVGVKESGGWEYPFTSSCSVMQRKMKLQYDQFVRSSDNKALTLAQVGNIANSLLEVKKDLQIKSEIVQRKYTITKALLHKAERSSFDRLCQQMYRLEAEQKRLEEDILVYSRLQEQLKHSPAFKKMFEVASQMESQADSRLSDQYSDSEISDISFEELLAREKKDSFWQRNGKLVSCSR